MTEVDASRGGLETLQACGWSDGPETLLVLEQWLFPSTQDREFLSLGVVRPLGGGFVKGFRVLGRDTSQ